jgi:HSP20 family protein
MNETVTQKAVTQQNGAGHARTATRPSVWFTPRFDLYETENEYALTGDLPGVAPQDLDVKFENQELTIHGAVAGRCHGGTCFAEEYGVGDFRRSFSVGELIDGSQISAELKDGVLTVHLPKRPDAKPRKIAVKSA